MISLMRSGMTARPYRGFAPVAVPGPALTAAVKGPVSFDRPN
jgi:hypothetical protein